MKKSTVLVLFCLASIFAIAQETNNRFQLVKQKTQDAYQQYVGQRVQFRKAIGMFETPSQVDNVEFFSDYIITKITSKPKKVGDSKKDNTEVIIEFKKVSDGSKEKFKGYNEVATKGTQILPLVEHIPLMLMGKFDAFKKEKLTEKITNEGVKESYSIIDVYIAGGEIPDLAEIFYITKGDITGRLVNCEASRAETECFKEALSGKYSAFLTKVEKPSDPNYRYGQTKTIDENGLTKYSYVDDMVDILIFTTQTQFGFVLKNISDNTQKIIWDEAVYVDYNGNTSKIMHSGVKFSQREGEQPATTIIKGAKIEDIACPINNVRYSKILKKWVTDSMFPSKMELAVNPIKLMLPIQIKDVINEYIFEFEVKWEFNHPELLK